MSLKIIFDLFTPELNPRDFAGKRFETEGANGALLEFEITKIIQGSGEEGLKAIVKNVATSRAVEHPFPQHNLFEDADWLDPDFSEQIACAMDKAGRRKAELDKKIAKSAKVADAKNALQFLRTRVTSADPKDTRGFRWVPIIEAISHRPAELRLEKYDSQDFFWRTFDRAEQYGTKLKLSQPRTEWLRDIAVRILERADGADRG